MAPKAKDAAPKAEGKAKAKAKVVKTEDEGPKMDRPDRAEFDAEIAKIADKIEGYQKEQAALAAQISEKSAGKEDFFAKKAGFRAQLDEFSAKIDALMERKGEINKAVGDKRQEGTEMRNQLNKMKKSIGYTNEADIDERIATIEFKMWTDSISLKEEKDFLKEIAELKRNKPKVSQVNKMEDNLSSRDSGANLKADIGTINEQINLYRDGKSKIQEQMRELTESRKAQLGDFSEIIEKREAISKNIQECIVNRNALRDDFRQKERDFNAHLNEQRRARQEKFLEEKAAKQAEWEMGQRMRKVEAMDVQPHVQEMTLIEQSILFCKSLIKEKKEEKEEKKEVAHENPEGTEVLAKKEDRDEFYFVPTKAGKKGKSKNKGGKEGSAKPIKHNAETFRLFDQLKLNAPITTDDVPATLEKLEEQLEMYKGKVATWEKERDNIKAKLLAGEEVEEEKAEEEKAEEEKAEEKEEEKDE